MSEKVFCIVIILFLLVIVGCSDSTSPDFQAPTNLELTLLEQNTIKLTWLDNSSDETKFFIDRRKGEFGWFENYGEVEANISVFTDNILTNTDTIYSYRVRAFDGDDYTDYSTPTGWYIPETAPTEFEVVEIEENNIKLTWEDNSFGELSFNIDRRLGGQDWNLNFLENPENSTYCYDYIEEPFDTLFYRVRATSGNASSVSNEESIISFFFTPSEFYEERISLNEVKLSWTDNCIYEDGFKIDKKIGDGEWINEIVLLNENIVEYIDAVNDFGTNFYRLYAYKGNSNSAKKTIINESIQYHIDNAITGDVIVIPSGVYYENLIIYEKDITLESHNGYTNCILDGSFNINDFWLGSDGITISGNNNSSVIEGFTIRNYSGFGIRCNLDSNPVIKNNIIHSNGMINFHWLGGISAISSSSIIINNLIVNNHGYGICEYSNSLIINNTISNNESYGIGSCFVSPLAPNPNIMNNIIFDNGDYSIYYMYETDISITYCNITDGTSGIINLGEGCINADPLFINSNNGNYHLQMSSPCIDTGNPDPQYNDTDGTRSDMGAYGGPEGDW